jgi:hypothetical protein
MASKITFPLRLDKKFSEQIDNLVFFTKAPSKHQYILDAIAEKMERDKIQLEGLSNESLRNRKNVP